MEGEGSIVTMVLPRVEGSADATIARATAAAAAAAAAKGLTRREEEDSLRRKRVVEASLYDHLRARLEWSSGLAQGEKEE
jgi:hypothetical protein